MNTSLYPAITQEPHNGLLGGPQQPGHEFELAEPWAYVWKHDGYVLRLPIPAGYSFEPSIRARIVWPIVSPLELLTASIPHDWVYGHKGGQDNLQGKPIYTHVWDGSGWTKSDEPWTHSQADRLFGRILKEQNVPIWKRYATKAAFAAAGQLVFNGGPVHGGPVYDPPLPTGPPTLSIDTPRPNR